MQLVWPEAKYLPNYVAALRQGWSANTLRPEAAHEELEAIETDPNGFLAALVDREAKGEPFVLPDGSLAQRLPGYTRWIWDGDFCGSINFRWQPGTSALPPTCLGHIGYSVVPWRRGHGYATRALAMLIEEIKAQGLAGVEFLEITTDPDNNASQRVIEKNGGVFIERFTRPPQFLGTEGMRYRVYLK